MVVPWHSSSTRGIRTACALVNICWCMCAGVYMCLCTGICDGVCAFMCAIASVYVRIYIMCVVWCYVCMVGVRVCLVCVPVGVCSGVYFGTGVVCVLLCVF